MTNVADKHLCPFCIWISSAYGTLYRTWTYVWNGPMTSTLADRQN